MSWVKLQTHFQNIREKSPPKSSKSDPGQEGVYTTFSHHDVLPMFPIKLLDGIDIKTEDLAKAYLQFDPVMARNELGNSLGCQPDLKDESDERISVINRIMEIFQNKNQNPYTIRIQGIDAPDQHITPLTWIHTAITSIRSIICNQEDMDMSMIIKETETQMDQLCLTQLRNKPQSLVGIFQNFNHFYKRLGDFILASELLMRDQYCDRYDVSSLVQLISPEHFTEKYVFVLGIPISIPRYQAVFVLENIEDIFMSLLSPHLKYLYYNTGLQFVSFWKIRPVLLVGLLQCAKFVSNKKTGSSSSKGLFPRIDDSVSISDAERYVFPTREELEKIALHVDPVVKKVLATWQDVTALVDQLVVTPKLLDDKFPKFKRAIQISNANTNPSTSSTPTTIYVEYDIPKELRHSALHKYKEEQNGVEFAMRLIFGMDDGQGGFIPGLFNDEEQKGQRSEKTYKKFSKRMDVSELLKQIKSITKALIEMAGYSFDTGVLQGIDAAFSTRSKHHRPNCEAGRSKKK